mgnify:CR=1 FL=1
MQGQPLHAPQILQPLHHESPVPASRHTEGLGETIKQDDAGRREQPVRRQLRIEKSIGLKRPLFEPSAEQAVKPHTMSISALRSM